MAVRGTQKKAITSVVRFCLVFLCVVIPFHVFISFPVFSIKTLNLSCIFIGQMYPIEHTSVSCMSDLYPRTTVRLTRVFIFRKLNCICNAPSELRDSPQFIISTTNRHGSVALGYGLDCQGIKVRFLENVANISFLHGVQTGSETNAASYPMGPMCLSSWG